MSITNLLQNIEILHINKRMIEEMHSFLSNQVNIIRESEITIKTKLNAKSAVGKLYVCNIKNDNIEYIYKKFRKTHGGNSPTTLIEMKYRMPIWSVLNRSNYFMKVIAVVTDNTDKNFKGLILENLNGYITINDICNDISINNKFDDEIIFNQFLEYFLSVCYVLFKLNLCSFIEHGGNLMTKGNNYKVIDLDDVGDSKFVGCSTNKSDQLDSLKQIGTMLINCDDHSNTDNYLKKLMNELSTYTTIENLFNVYGFDINKIIIPNDEEIKIVKETLKNF